ncbi:bifunctional DNA primase/polymerase [uncultured Mediterranean phage uvMED]|nr:bifunctional DNA primase/polymerase [uncultured Mediterranean phage uvMED]BAR21940.1 bifunctional DNA primase/polymerase [uncultured Mediterranean phage uvMED]BAR22027.1 bifunctional DNA primase/polymerase [uncultured Mediterranean phage uvMED]
MNGKNFIPDIPLNWVTCPIYAQGVALPKRNDASPDRVSDGKVPYGKAWKQSLTVNDSALMIEREPDKFKAIGIFTGQKSDGLVIFDVDKNLGAIEKKWGKDLKNAPKVTSLRKNAAKFLFKVPEDLVGEVASISQTAAGHEGWEILWGGQGVVAGEYYKEGVGKGEYTLEGSLYEVPDAPEWLLSRMKDQYKKNNKDVDVKYTDNRWSKRSKEERVAIVSGCLSVIRYKGPNSEDYWWEIGAMINNELPGIEGLELWTEWSRRDPDYEHCWEDGLDPCAARWYATWRNDGARYNMSHLIELADEVDPERKRFKATGLDKLIEDVEAIPLRYKEEILDGEDLIQRYTEIDNDPKNENPALHNQAVHKLAIEAKRGNAAEIERLVDTHEMFQRTKGQKPLTPDELDDTPFEYLIPGLLPKPWTLLVHADGGTGKTAMCQTIGKHIGQGKAFNVYGGLVNVPVGKVLWLNGDQNERILRRQMKLIGCDKNVRVVTEWDMQWYSRFKKMQNKYAYDLIIIDSLDGCNDSNPYEENRREYALPIKKLVRRNGQDFPACSIIIIHHNTKEGKFRGTSAIKNAVDETWNMRKLSLNDAAEMGLTANSRLVSVEKSREDREGLNMIFTLLPDYTYSITPAPERTEEVVVDTPNKHTLDILRFMRKENKPFCVKDLVEHDTLGGAHRKRAIIYSLNKLEDQKLIKEVDVPKDINKGGRPPKFYKAIGKELPKLFSSLPRDIPREGVYKPNNVVTGTDSINKEIGINPNFVKTSEEENSLYKEGVYTKPIVNETSSTGTEEGLNTQSSGYIEEMNKFWEN